MPSLTAWAERDFDIGALEKYCESSKQAINILIDLWISNATALTNMAAIIEHSCNEKNDEEVLNNFLEDKIADRVAQALFQFGKGGTPLEAQHVKSLRRCLVEHEQKLPGALEQLRSVSTRLSSVSAELNDARKSKMEADQALLSAIMSKSELEKRFTPSAVGTSQLPASAINIMKKCDDRIKAAQAAQLESGQRLTEVREQLEDITQESSQSRRDNLQIIENIEKRKLVSIATTSNEILSLQMLLSSSLAVETEGIIETGNNNMQPHASINTSVMSTGSSVGFSSTQSIQGLDWVEQILKMDPSERNLFMLNQIAEEVASQESEEEIKIQDLEQEIAKIKAQITELQEGKGTFADRLAADYAGGISMNPDASKKLSQAALLAELFTPKFSLPLPLKTDCYAKNFWQGFALEEGHSDLSKLIDLPVQDHENWSAEWNIIAYEHILLGYFEITSRYPHFLSTSQWNKLRTVIQTARLKLRIPTKHHEGIVELMLPDSIEIQDTITPLDPRFRLLRLLANTGKVHADPELFKKWQMRQLSYLDLTIRGMQKEDSTGLIESVVAPIFTVLLSGVTSQEEFDCEVATELLEHLSTYTEETMENSTLPVPRAVLHQLVSRIWKLCLASIGDEESGLSSDTNVVAAFVYNFLTARMYHFHPLWISLELWESVMDGTPLVPASAAKQILEIMRAAGPDVKANGDKWLDKMCGDLFWFGKGGAGGSSIGSASPQSVNSSLNRSRSLMERSSAGSQQAEASDLFTRTLALDLAYLRVLTRGVRDSIIGALSDYRSRLEPDSLEICIEIFKQMMARSNAQVPLYLWPSTQDFTQFLNLMCERFISESARAVCNRLIEPNKYLDSIAVARAHANDESRGVWIQDVTGAIWKVIFEFHCEMDVYALAWVKSDLTSRHKLIWSKGLQSRIRAVVELINRDDDLWLSDRVPPGGQDLLAVLQVWERISGDGGLTDVIRPKISRSLLLHLDRVERDSLPLCVHNNHGDPGTCWAATRPPHIVHSTKCVDLWTTIFTAVQACIDSASAQLSMGTCAQMIVRCVERYCDNAKEGFMADVAYAHPLMLKARRCFNRLVRSAEDDTELPDFFKNKKKRKNRLFKKDLNTSVGSGEESAGEDARRASTTSMSQEGLNLIGDNNLFLSDYLVVTCKMASHDATALMVRMHDMAFSIGELDKVRETLKDSIEKEHVRLSRLFKSKAKFETSLPTSASGEVMLPKLPKESLQAMAESIESGISDATDILFGTGGLVSTYLGLNMVFSDMREDLFERLYMPSCKDFPLSRILRRFENEKLTSFALMTPIKWRTDLVRSIINNFVLAWVYVVADMASRGRVFRDSDSSVMNSDLTALHRFAEELGLRQDLETQDILRTVGCLPVYVSGSTPAEFKASCERCLADPSEKSKAKSRLQKAAAAAGATSKNSK